MAPQIRAAADEIERARRLPASIVAALKAAGVFGMAMPRVWGGPELDAMTQFRVLEALAMVDASVAWCMMINCDGGYITAFWIRMSAGRCIPTSRSAPRQLPPRPDRHSLSRRLSRQRTFPVRQWLPAFGMGLARLYCHSRWDAACGWQWCPGNPAVPCEAVAM